MSSVPRPKIMWARVESGIRKRINDSGKTVYEVRVRRKGQPERTITCPTLREARRQRDTMRARAWEGRHIQGAEGRRKTVAELCESFLKARYAGRTDPSHRPTHEGHLRWWCERIGNHSLATISPETLVPYREELLGRVTPTTCHRYFASLSGAFTWAMQDERQWVAANPVRLVSRPRDERPLETRERIRFLAADERERLLAACKQSRCPWLYQIVVMALSTGARKAELLNLRWRDVDLQAGTVVFRVTKNRSDRVIALVDPVISILRDRARAPITPRPGSFVFPAPCGTKPVNIRSAWAAAVREAGLAGLRFHDLRHSAASYLRLAGYALADIADLLGHRSLTVTRRYSHLDDAFQREMLGATMGRIFGAEGGGEA